MDVCSDVDSLCPRWLFLDGRDGGAFEGIVFYFFYKKQVFSLSQANIILWQADVKIFNRSEQNTEKDAWRYLEMVSSHN